MIQVTLTETAASKVKDSFQRSDPETGQPLGSLEDTYLRMYVAAAGLLRLSATVSRSTRGDPRGRRGRPSHGLKSRRWQQQGILDGSSVDYAEKRRREGFLVSNRKLVNLWMRAELNPKGEEAADQPNPIRVTRTHTESPASASSYPRKTSSSHSWARAVESE